MYVGCVKRHGSDNTGIIESFCCVVEPVLTLCLLRAHAASLEIVAALTL
jgi:hypothetical protein